MKLLVGFIFLISIGAGLSFLFFPREIFVRQSDQILENLPLIDLFSRNESSAVVIGATGTSSIGSLSDVPNDRPLANPPSEIKAIYLTGWSASLRKKIDYVKKIAAETEINSVVIDIKDYSGQLSHRTDLPEAVKSGANKEIKISELNALIKEFHDAGIYLIGRIAVFQDPTLAKAHPEWALKEASSTRIWFDQKGLSWMDPAAKPVWDYNIAIAKDILNRGFDEVNFDYIRFPTDGNLSNIDYPYWDKKQSRHEVIADFFSYLRSSLPGARLSADLFGLVTVNKDDLGIGQVIEDAYRYFDYVSPMIYPSHYASGFLGYKNPALYPYEVVKYSMDNAIDRLERLSSELVLAAATSSLPTMPRPLAKLRPWIQDFNLGATYNASMVRKQINASYDAASGTPSLMNGWMIWSPSNIYTVDAFLPENK